MEFCMLIYELGYIKYIDEFSLRDILNFSGKL